MKHWRQRIMQRWKNIKWSYTRNKMWPFMVCPFFSPRGGTDGSSASNAVGVRAASEWPVSICLRRTRTQEAQDTRRRRVCTSSSMSVIIHSHSAPNQLLRVVGIIKSNPIAQSDRASFSLSSRTHSGRVLGVTDWSQANLPGSVDQRLNFPPCPFRLDLLS